MPIQQTPKFKLEDVKRIIEDFVKGKDDAIFFSAKTRSLNCVMEVLECDLKEAKKFILTGMLKLEEGDFACRGVQWNTTMDTYGLENYQEHNWYVKFSICDEDGGYIEQVSFHPVEQVLRLQNGRVLHVTYKETKV